jgi:hypothetical protein
MYIYEDIAQNSSQNEKCFRKICRENSNPTFLYITSLAILCKSSLFSLMFQLSNHLRSVRRGKCQVCHLSTVSYTFSIIYDRIKHRCTEHRLINQGQILFDRTAWVRFQCYRSQETCAIIKHERNKGSKISWQCNDHNFGLHLLFRKRLRAAKNFAELWPIKQVIATGLTSLSA